jgi:glycosyltransferase involved in cell wall biosynthesis
MTPAVDISIIVPCRNEARYIRPFLESLLSQELGEMRSDILIADGMSTDGTRQIIDEYMSKGHIRTIDNPEKIVSTGLNRAVLAASGEFVIRMDIHTEYASDYVRRCVETLVATGAWNVGGPARTKADGWMACAIAAAYHSPFACGGARFHNDQYEGWVDTVTYGCWRKSTLEQLGMFDEALVRNQDDELNLRTIRAGGGVWQSPAIVSWYHPRDNLRDLVRQYFQYGFWKVAVIRKHRQPASWRHLVPGAFVLAAAAGLPVTAAMAIAGFHAAATIVASVWATLMTGYAVACGAAALWTARRTGWNLLPILPVVFACYHFSYGTGFLSGFTLGSLRESKKASENMFNELSR